VILVVGGAGYIGSHFVRHERGRGSDVLVLDTLEKGHREAVLDAPLVVGSTGDRALLDAVFSQNQIDAVVHFAAYSSVGESVTNPGAYYRNNVGNTTTLLEAMRDHDVRRIVFSSTAAAYGNPVRLPLDEEHPRQPINPYGRSKVMCETVLHDFREAHGISYVALRYFNAAGAHPDALIGESHSPEWHLVPIVLQVALGQRPAISVFGADYDTLDGTCIRDYIHILDLADAHSRALDHLATGGDGGIMNLGTARGNSVLEVLEVCRRVTGHPIPAEEEGRRPGDPPALVASSDRARKTLGWAPQYESLEDIVQTAWAWERNRRY
jgi:UDP-glucose 4-epimerase